LKYIDKITLHHRLAKTLLVFALLLLVRADSYAIDNPLNLRRGCKTANDSDIVLKWIVPSDVCNSFRAYHIYARKDSFSPFLLIDSVLTLNQPEYLHRGAFLQANTWQYFVVIQTDCGGNATQSSDTLSIDLTQTLSQFIDSVSVDEATGKYIIGWKTNSSLDLAGYKIYVISGANNVELSDVDYATKQYLDNSSSPSTATKTYSIAAYDSCNNITAIIDRHTPVLASSSFDSCSHVFTVTWSAYVGFTVSKYEILASINGAAFVSLGFVSSGPLTYASTDTSFHNGDNVCFLVRAISNTAPVISSSSNKTCLAIKFISIPTINYISSVNVVDDANIKIDWLTDDFSLVSKLLVQQSTNGVSYITRRSITPTANGLTINLDSLSTSDTKYYFRTIVYNTCDQPLDTSIVCNSILLQAIKINSGTNRIDWNDYLRFDASVDHYEIYQGTGDPILGHTFSLVASVSSDSLGYTDQSFPSLVLNDGVCYYVAAFEAPGNSFGVISATSISNEVCVAGDLIVFFPNVFKPNSAYESNKLFKPRGLYIDYAKSWMKIYNRWGELVFETTDLSVGWNGSDANGDPLPDGQYIFQASIASLKKIGQTHKGVVTLLR
jgi:gliding motility-associated-like protein